MLTADSVYVALQVTAKHDKLASAMEEMKQRSASASEESEQRINALRSQYEGQISRLKQELSEAQEVRNVLRQDIQQLTATVEQQSRRLEVQQKQLSQQQTSKSSSSSGPTDRARYFSSTTSCLKFILLVCGSSCTDLLLHKPRHLFQIWWIYWVLIKLQCVYIYRAVYCLLIKSFIFCKLLHIYKNKFQAHHFTRKKITIKNFVENFFDKPFMSHEHNNNKFST